MTALAILVAFVIGFFVGQRDMQKDWLREEKWHHYWFDKYIWLANRVAADSQKGQPHP